MKDIGVPATPTPLKGTAHPHVPVLEMLNVDKRFLGVHALTEANLTVSRGEVHALVGENGAGKSTLIKILGGVHQMDSGEIRVDGQPVTIGSPHEAMARGISVIHQELMLVPDMTVAQNLFLGREPTRAGFIDWKTLYENARSVLERFELDIDPRSRIRRLGVARQQMVEIARAMSFDTAIVVMDEPTATLTINETEHLFQLVQRLQKHGVSTIYISHRMEEIFHLADRATVLRDGKTVGTVFTADADHDQIVRMMVGRDIDTLFTKRNVPRTEVILDVRDLNSPRVKDISFTVRQGEILGFAGLVGSGRTEVIRAVFGLDTIVSGTVTVNQTPVRIQAPRDAIAAGIGYLTEDRKTQGIVPDLPVAANISLTVLDRLSRLGFIRRAERNSLATRFQQSLSIRAASLTMAIKNLSGGNQQKALIARSLATNARVLLLDEPTRGIDVGAKQDVYNVISTLAENGIGVVFVSSELRELLAMSDRIAVMWRNRITGILSGAEMTQENIIHLATGGTIE
jgi:ribose transport system ATP-binding protein